ncbi:hypothetical protein [Oceaniovalibus guishaninsula]|uniref:hypothetical protein n=1 Tax=Oceaniovalibus guishaninsula TaxID=1046117 RepID=UPI0012E9A023|nr:hypothetical protein [Oceaniovalibus guishaninsula]
MHALLSSPEWERRLAEARRQREKAMAARADRLAAAPVVRQQGARHGTQPSAGGLAAGAALATGLILFGMAIWGAPQSWPKNPVAFPNTVQLPQPGKLAPLPVLPTRPRASHPNRVPPLAASGPGGDIPGIDSRPPAAIATATQVARLRRSLAFDRAPSLPPVFDVTMTATAARPSQPAAAADPSVQSEPPSTAGKLSVTLHVPANGTDIEAVAAVAAIGARLEHVIEGRLAPTRTSVRFYHPRDRAASESLARTLGGQAQDFASFRPLPPPGTVDILLTAPAFSGSGLDRRPDGR